VTGSSKIPPPDVSVLIPVYNEEAHLGRAAAAMLDQDFDGTIEFLFVDGRSTDASREILTDVASRDARVRMLDNPARGTTAALNIGLQAARGEIVARMDAHTYYPRAYLAVGVRRLRDGDALNVSGPALATGAGGWSDAVALALNGAFGTGGAAFRHAQDEEFEVDSGFAGVWLRATLVDAGGWDEEWVADEDFELASRLRKAGGTLVCVPAMAASYIPRDTLAGLARQYWRYGYFRPMTARRHPESMRRSHAAPPALALAATAALVGPRPTRLLGRAGIGAWLAATAAVALKARAGGARSRDAARLPVVFGVMHFTYGFAFLAGCVRMGVPFAALRGLVRRRSQP
jgi:glycosyltransferase involved in cell wall biosynthesis